MRDDFRGLRFAKGGPFNEDMPRLMNAVVRNPSPLARWFVWFRA